MKKQKLPYIVQQIRNYKPPFINFGTQKVISHTQLTKFNNCNFGWGLHYRDGHKIFNPGIALIYGTAIHECIQDYLSKYYNESAAAANRMDLEIMFKDKLRFKYQEEFKKNGNIHFSDVDEMEEHYIDGLETIRYFKRKKEKYFSKKGWFLVGCEIPINYNALPNVYYNGYLDVVLYHEPTNTIEIIDLKTSTRAWYDKSKKDENKLAQLLLYKKLFADQFEFPIDNISVKFLILKRKIKEEGEFKEHRIQEFIPASGKGKINKAVELLENFTHSAFEDDGKMKLEKFKKTISKESCMFCPYKTNEELCSKGTPNTKWRDPFSIF